MAENFEQIQKQIQKRIQLDQNIIATRCVTGLKEKEIESRIKDLDCLEQSLVILALRVNNSSILTGYALKAFNSLRACQNFNLLIK